MHQDNTGDVAPESVIELVKVCPSVGTPIRFRGQLLADVIVGNGGDHRANTRTIRAEVWVSEKGHMLGKITYVTNDSHEFRGKKVCIVYDDGRDLGCQPQDRKAHLEDFNDALTSLCVEDFTWSGCETPTGDDDTDTCVAWLDRSREVDHMWGELVAKVQAEIGYSIDFDAEPIH
jgi:hypothetical protein